MLSLDQILSQYPQEQRQHKRNILREYLQYQILDLIFSHGESKKLTFLGGTALRIVHGNSRFSEDIDFDNFKLGPEQFCSIAETVKKGLEQRGLSVSTKEVTKGAFRCYIKFPQLLYDLGLSGYKEEQVLIQFDTEPQHFQFTPEIFILNKFEVFSQIQVTPRDVLLSQKLHTAFNRKRAMGRDFYDIVFLLGLGTKPNLDYLNTRLSLSSTQEIRDYVLEKSKTLDFKALAKDVQPFLFNPADAKKVALFADYIGQRGWA